MAFRNPLTVDATARAQAQAAQTTANAAYTAAAAATATATAATTAANAITSTQITDGAVRTPALAAGAVTTAKIAAGAVTAGTIAAGAVTAGTIAAGAIDGQTITGALIRTAAAGKRVQLDYASANRVALFSGDTAETAPGGMSVSASTNGSGSDNSTALVQAPTWGTGTPATISLQGATRDGTDPGYIKVQGGSAGGVGSPAIYVGGPAIQTTGAPVTFAAGMTQFAAGVVTITPTAANTPTGKAVSFGKSFAAAPEVFVCPQSSNPGTFVTGCAAQGITTTGATVYLTRTDTAATTVMWFAVAPGI